MRLLVANRGEIATRILSAARELEIETFAIYSGEDVSHTYNADHTVQLPSASSYLDIGFLIEIASQNKVDAVHPGYGFLSESAEFAARMTNEAGITVIGPGSSILERTGDKLQARLLAQECNVPVLPALTTPTNDPETVTRFARQSGFPIMIKAVDGGGGRGIRLVTEPKELDSSLRRAIEESPSKQVFVEKAAVNGYRHVEIQIVGDHHGNLTHLWERECSIQRRYQKVIELAPSTVTDRHLVQKVIESALEMARKINYKSLGTFEFLVNPQTKDFFFLEVNPRLQVEHTITESICSTDIVRAQLLIAQGASLEEAGIRSNPSTTRSPPLHSMQLRITAEDPTKNHTLSIGKIQSFYFPSGNGIRVDTNLISTTPSTITSDYDSLIAKLIITAPTFSILLQKARRALSDTQINGIKTNLPLLRAILSHESFINGECDTQWLESHHESLLTLSASIPTNPNPLLSAHAQTPPTQTSAAPVMFRKGQAFTLALTPTVKPKEESKSHITLTKIREQNFPTTLSGDLTLTTAGNSNSYAFALASTSTSASAVTAGHRLASPGERGHVAVPFPGKLVEILVDASDYVREDEAIAVVRAMKMEVEIRAPFAGTVSWVFEGEEGEDVGDGTLVAVISPDGQKAKL